MMKVTVPGKVFIAGEYGALKGYPTLSVAVKPHFVYTREAGGEFKLHPQSPAGRLAGDNHMPGVLTDPYAGTGGMGRSTAEFLVKFVQTPPGPSFLNQNPSVTAQTIWQKYREVTSKEPNPPSGVDLITQIMGGYCVTEWSKLQEEPSANAGSSHDFPSPNRQSLGAVKNKGLRREIWGFPNLDWVVILTGHKVKTHEHLAQLAALDWATIENLNRKIIAAFEAQDEKSFIEGLKQWRDFLKRSSLEVATTTELVEEFLETPGVKAAKGCGALGSDAIVIFFDKSAGTFINGILEGWNPRRVIRSNQVSESGLEVGYEDLHIRSL